MEGIHNSFVAHPWFKNQKVRLLSVGQHVLCLTDSGLFLFGLGNSNPIPVPIDNQKVTHVAVGYEFSFIATNIGVYSWVSLF